MKETSRVCASYQMKTSHRSILFGESPARSVKPFLPQIHLFWNMIRLRIAVDEYHYLMSNICAIPVRFIIFNTTSLLAKVRLNIKKQERAVFKELHSTSRWFAKKHDAEEMEQLEAVPQKEYFWSGITQHRCENLMPLHEISFG